MKNRSNPWNPCYHSVYVPSPFHLPSKHIGVEMYRAIAEIVAFCRLEMLIPTLKEENNLGMFGNSEPRIIFEVWRILR
jgi:hypothetical protein